jgi:hypothetical protein
MQIIMQTVRFSADRLEFRPGRDLLAQGIFGSWPMEYSAIAAVLWLFRSRSTPVADAGTGQGGSRSGGLPR